MALERSGGLLGRPIRRGLDSADLPAAEAVRLRELVRGAVPPDDGSGRRAGGAMPRGAPAERGPVGGADRFIYTLEVDYAPEGDQQGERTVRTFSEPAPEELRPLLALLRVAPLLPARGRDTLR
ncbi:hypothetical protein FraQA3DRAFT_0659 [Frankia sp. QA3]|nr:hypothetical protein FraQA3DRAFT_0659 [Frankia sp. QA3]